MEEQKEINIGFDPITKIIGFKLEDAIFLVKTVKSRCDFCKKEGFMLKCSNCFGSYYCSKECQKSHYKEHKSVCEIANKESKDFKKNLFFKKSLSILFYTRILQKIRNVPKKMKKKRFWYLSYDNDINKFLFSAMDKDEINEHLNKIFIDYPELKNYSNFGIVYDESCNGTFICVKKTN